jgi:hypothetical protein
MRGVSLLPPSLILLSVLLMTSAHAQSVEIAANAEKPNVMVEHAIGMYGPSSVKAHRFKTEFGCFLAGIVASHQQGIEAMCYGEGLNGHP